MAGDTTKYIFITGAGSGIGHASARLFAARGWRVGLADVNEAGLAETATGIAEAQRTLFTLDVRDRTHWARALQQFSDWSGGRLDVLFNNAGVARGGWFEDLAPDDIDETVDVNLKGVLNGIYTSLPRLKQTPGARVINTASVAGFLAAPRMAAYVASKHAVIGLSEALDLEFSRFGVRVIAIAPWFIDTALLDQPMRGDSNRAPRQNLSDGGVRLYPPERVAACVWDAAHGNARFHTVGREAAQAHWLKRFAPALVRARLRRMLG